MSKSTFEKAAAEFRQHLPDLTSQRFLTAKEQSCYEYADEFTTKQNPPWLYTLTQAWAKLFSEPYHGVSSDGQLHDFFHKYSCSRATGNIMPDVYKIQDEGVPIDAIVEAVETVKTKLTPAQLDQASHKFNDKKWRAWSNPEILLRPFGVRLEEITEEAAQSILALLKATFSAEGYEKALAAMRINHFLGEVCQLPAIMNKYSYNFLIFGTPSTTKAWGFSLYGHHLCLNIFLRGPQIIIAPTFTGAEPNVIDDGPFFGTAILHQEGEYGLQLMQSLGQEDQKKAQIYKLLHDPAMLQTGDLTVDRWNKDDQRHVCGAFRDNRTVPYEGVCASTMNSSQKSLILSICKEFLLYLPTRARELKLKSIEEHFDETYFCWIGSYGNEDAFYYRVQSPVIIVEFDHHSGVFLNNTEPGKFHTHTIVRYPNGGDYGNVLRDEEDRL